MKRPAKQLELFLGYDFPPPAIAPRTNDPKEEYKTEPTQPTGGDTSTPIPAITAFRESLIRLKRDLEGNGQ